MTINFQLQLSVNGILSFQSSFTSFRAIEFPSTLVPVIAPLWADFNFRDSGAIYYRVTQDEKTLRKFTDLISDENPIFRDYHPKECVIVTWSFANLSSQELGETIVSCMHRGGWWRIRSSMMNGYNLYMSSTAISNNPHSILERN